MVGDKIEEEQIELLKKWLNENGTSIIVSIVVVLAVVFGYRTWETQTRETAEAASVIYEELVEAVTVNPPQTISDENLSTSKFLANQLKSEYSNSTYAQFAAMHLAKLAVEAAELETAATELQWALDNGSDSKVAIIANLRLAKVKFALKEYDSAIAQLDTMEAGSHKSSYEELRGDIYYAMGSIDESREAYQRAVNLQTINKKPMTQMKLDDLVAPAASIAVDETGTETAGEGDVDESATGDEEG